ncbi:MAG: hypothetical protein ACK2UI_00990 [Anaerolineae bacterium]
MKKFLIIFLAANVVLGALAIGLLGGTLFLAETRPLDYSSPFYGVQVQAETWRLRFSRDETRRADFALKLVDRRLADLGRAQGETTIGEAATAVQKSLDEAIRDINAVPTENQETLYARLDQLLVHANVIVDGLVSTYDSGPVLALSERLAELQKADTREELVALTPPAPSLAAEIIPFLNKEIDHSDYSLEGAHADVACESCHADGEYKGTARECVDCHQAPVSGIYASHFDGECVDCHTLEDWTPYQFDHLAVAECESCHTKDRPVAHYDPPDASIKYLAAVRVQALKEMPTPTAFYGEDTHTDTCTRCHTDTTDWNVADFDHFGFNDCADCHQEEEDTPIDHYDGQCSNCHNTSAWEDAWFDHTGFIDCASCHTEETPVAHYTGYACASCHTTTQWKPVAFSHSGVTDCVDCHTEDTPVEHYPGQCSACHTTEDWTTIAFDHAGASDCLQCHQTPTIHWQNDCLKCHTTTDWYDVHFSHDGLTDCTSCHSKSNHYGGQCSKCHTTSNWGDVRFNHGGLTTCAVCHESDVQAAHYPGSCETCHTTGSWGDVAYDHEGVRVCLDCHSDVLPPDHYTGDCTLCHNADDWNDVSFNHINAFDCTSCHDDDTPAAHYEGECSECHTTISWAFAHPGLNSTCSSCHTIDGHWPGECSDCHLSTQDWGDYIFDHTGYTNCKSCHERPDGHPRGQCSKCHSTDNWIPTGEELPDGVTVPGSATEAPDRPTPTTPTVPPITTAPSR